MPLLMRDARPAAAATVDYNTRYADIFTKIRRCRLQLYEQQIRAAEAML